MQEHSSPNSPSNDYHSEPVFTALHLDWLVLLVILAMILAVVGWTWGGVIGIALAVILGIPAAFFVAGTLVWLMGAAVVLLLRRIRPELFQEQNPG